MANWQCPAEDPNVEAAESISSFCSSQFQFQGSGLASGAKPYGPAAFLGQNPACEGPGQAKNTGLGFICSPERFAPSELLNSDVSSICSPV
mmetsp:Transcript_60133/g.107316  ORF Transcript_60133/g.107316 Transcript_60133/m.107316 type:complete len:91 (+) Transcript_60133:329-601(+)